MSTSPQLSEEQLQNLPLEELEALVFQRASELQLAMEGSDMATEEELMGAAPAPAGAEAAPSPAAPMVNPDLVLAATSVLVSAGLLPEVTDQLTPEVVAALQSLVDKIRPGLYDLSVPEELMEVLNGLANGTIGLDIGGDAAAAAGPAGGGPAGPAGAGGPAGPAI